MTLAARRILAAAMAALLWAAVPAAFGQGWTTTEHEITVDGLKRSFLIHAPTTNPDSPLPAMLVLHGGLGNAEGVERLYGMNDVAAREGFVAVYPNGTPIGKLLLRQRRTWNAGECCGPAADNDVDDVAFIRALIGELVAEHSVDPRRVYVSGMSNGAMMTYRLVCELPDVIAAAIPVAGTLVLASCADGQDVPILHIHGANDDNVPVAGGIGERAVARIDYRPLAEVFGMLAQARGCDAPTVRTDEFGARESTYACARGAPIVVKILPGVGHTWPGAEPRPLQRNRYSGGFSASEAAWAFARRFTR